MQKRVAALIVVLLVMFALSPSAARAGTTCSFDRGTTTCTTITQSTTTGTHTEVSGCLYGPSGVTGVRQRTFADSFLVTTITTTMSHGKEGPVYSSQTSTTRQLAGSTLISDTCQPL